MREPAAGKRVERLLVVMPTWLGDCVMATPTLRALRELYPQAHIAALSKDSVRPILGGCPWINRVVTARGKRKGTIKRRRRLLGLSRRLAAGRFDTAVLLPNSFKTAMVVALAGIPRRIGYDRDGRGFMLTDRLLPLRLPGGAFAPVPTRDYYLGIARYLGATSPDPTMRLFTHPEDDAEAAALLQRAGVDANGRRLVLLNPGANKLEKRWPVERFAQLADRLATEFGVAVAVTGSPKEREVLDAVVTRSRAAVADLSRHGLDLTLLKSVVKRAGLVVTNDTGTRHVAAALNVPVVTLFGPTAPEWTEIHFADERQVVTREACDACRARGATACMHTIGVDAVYDRAAELLRAHTPALSGPMA